MESLCPDTGVLYSVSDLARLAGVPRVTIIRRCRAGRMPPWRIIEGRRYWDRVGAVEALYRLLGPPPNSRDAA
jgi:hypothetical protein